MFRARFSEITPTSIRRSCETLTEPDINVSDAVDVRQELDLRIGKWDYLYALYSLLNFVSLIQAVVFRPLSRSGFYEVPDFTVAKDLPRISI